MTPAGLPSEFEFEPPTGFELPVVPNIPPVHPPGPAYYKELAKVGTVVSAEGDVYPETPDQRVARRLSDRLPDGYKPTSAADITFDPRVAYEIAIGIDQPGAVFAKYGIDEQQAVWLAQTPAFAATVQKYKEEILAGGVSFKLKAKIQAEDLLTHSYLIATDPEAPMAVRADIIKWTARVAGLEPKEDKGNGSGSGFVLNISFAGDRPAATIEGEVVNG